MELKYNHVPIGFEGGSESGSAVWYGLSRQDKTHAVVVSFDHCRHRLEFSSLTRSAPIQRLQEAMKEERMNFKASAKRDTPPKENLRLFDLLLKGDKEAEPYCLRAKADYASVNGEL